MNKFHTLMFRYATSKRMEDFSRAYAEKPENINTVKDLYSATLKMIYGQFRTMMEVIFISIIMVMMIVVLLFLFFAGVSYPFTGKLIVPAVLFYIMFVWYVVYRFNLVEKFIVLYSKIDDKSGFGKKIHTFFNKEITDDDKKSVLQGRDDVQK